MPATTSGPSLRLVGIIALVLFLITDTVGGSLALESSYLPLTLASHIGLAVVTLAVSGFGAGYVSRSYKRIPRGSARGTAFCAFVGVVAGTVFLLGGQNNYALYVMEAFGVLGVIAALLTAVLGGPSGREALPAPVQ